MIRQLPRGPVWNIRHLICPECEDFVAELMLMSPDRLQVSTTALVWPRNADRPVPPEVDATYAQDFKEAAAILSISPKASAAVSRRLVQDVIRASATPVGAMGVATTLVAPISRLSRGVTLQSEEGQRPSWLGVTRGRRITA